MGDSLFRSFFLLSALFILSTAKAYAYWHNPTGTSHHEAHMSMNAMAGMEHMMRPDMAPPVGVMGAMSPGQGTLMLSLRCKRMKMDGNRGGTESVSTSEVFSQYPVAPLEMDAHMLMSSAIYGITDDFSVMAMVPYVRKSMDHVTRTGVEFTTKSDGLRDITLVGSYDIFKSDSHIVKLSPGLSFEGIIPV